MSYNCNYQKCLTCSIDECWTGEIARTKGIEEYNKHLEMLDEAEKELDKKLKNCKNS